MSDCWMYLLNMQVAFLEYKLIKYLKLAESLYNVNAKAIEYLFKTC